MPTRDPWFPYRSPVSNPRLRLFCLPYAGGAASMYRSWQASLPPYVEVFPVQYPGRESRLAEKPYNRLEALVDAVLTALAPYLFSGPPFAFFGHSLGAMVAYLLARKLEARGGPTPAYVIVSGSRPPHLRDTTRNIHDLPETEFVTELGTLNGTPKEVLQNKDLMSLLLPQLRADFAAAETYVHQSGPPLHCPIIALGGQDDPKASEADIRAWQAYTTSTFAYEMFPGDHFFLNDVRPAVLASLSRQLAHA